MRNPNSLSPCRRGFTLLELLVVIFILGLLSSWSYTYYQKQLARTQLLQSMTALLQAEDQLNRYYERQNTYRGFTLTPLTQDPNKNYQIEAHLTDEAYRLTVQTTPSKTHPSSECSTLWVDQQGERGPSHCWYHAGLN